jgi:pimeloyl-ACP methyl ester carboxylesterase
MSQTKNAITLIHGTFAPNARWTWDDSSLCRHLTDRLGPSTRFFRFNWSGRNDHEARLEAGKSLRKFLRARLAELPDYRHTIVAHSHGGNVALYGLADFEGTVRIDGLICMGTPYISFAARDLARMFDGLSRGIATIGTVAFAILVVIIVQRNEPLWIWLAAFLVGMSLIGVWLTFPPGGRIYRWAVEKQGRLLRDFHAGARCPVPLLSVKARLEMMSQTQWKVGMATPADSRLTGAGLVDKRPVPRRLVEGGF